MLRRAPSPTNRERRREQQRRHRQREREGLRTYLVDLDGDIVNMLVCYGWLADGAAGDDREVGCAVRRLLVDVATNALPLKKP
jgi:hypothetical protein